MGIICGIAKTVIIAFYLFVLLLASNQHGKAWKGSINFWIVLAVVAGNFATLIAGGFFKGFLNFCA